MSDILNISNWLYTVVLERGHVVEHTHARLECVFTLGGSSLRQPLTTRQSSKTLITKHNEKIQNTTHTKLLLQTGVLYYSIRLSFSGMLEFHGNNIEH